MMAILYGTDPEPDVRNVWTVAQEADRATDDSQRWERSKGRDDGITRWVIASGTFWMLWEELADQRGPVATTYAELAEVRAILRAGQGASAVGAEGAVAGYGGAYFTREELAQHDERIRLSAIEAERESVREAREYTEVDDPAPVVAGLQALERLVVELVAGWDKHRGSGRTEPHPALMIALDKMVGAAVILGWVTD